MSGISSYQLITAATGLAVTRVQAKEHLRIASSNTTFDNLIDTIIPAATKQLENDTDLVVMEQDYRLVLDDFPSELSGWNANILIWRYPVTEITNIRYYPSNDEDVLTDLATSNYEYDLAASPSRIKINDVPSVADKLGAVQVNFKAGRASANDVDENIKRIIKLLIGHYFENPDAVVTGTQVNTVPLGYDRMIQSYIKRKV